MRMIDQTGKRFGMLVVVERAPRIQEKKSIVRWVCQCDCGKTAIVWASNLKCAKSCGCAQYANPPRLTHGCCYTPTFSVWQNMRCRCENINNDRYAAYGGRGIRICERWRNSFSNFLEDMGEKPSPKHSIDRIDNDGDYEPENCRWATAKEQARNRRSSRMVTIDGVTKCAAEWCEIYGMALVRFHSRIHRGWSELKALTAPVRKKAS